MSSGGSQASHGPIISKNQLNPSCCPPFLNPSQNKDLALAIGRIIMHLNTVLGVLLSTVRQVTVTAPAEHPFFVYGVGWASLEPELSMERFALECRQLAPGDVCISLSSPPAAQQAKPN